MLCRICRICIEICRIGMEICKIICRIWHKRWQKICRIVTGPNSAYSTYICKICQEICKIICRICKKICQKVCKPVWNMQNSDRFIFCIFVIYMHSPFCWCSGQGDNGGISHHSFRLKHFMLSTLSMSLSAVGCWTSGTCMFESHSTPQNPVKQGSVTMTMR